MIFSPQKTVNIEARDIKGPKGMKSFLDFLFKTIKIIPIIAPKTNDKKSIIIDNLNPR